MNSKRLASINVCPTLSNGTVCIPVAINKIIKQIVRIVPRQCMGICQYIITGKIELGIGVATHKVHCPCFMQSFNRASLEE